MKNKTHSKKAFTLIELLMVIAIIGILAGILIPTVNTVRKQANIAASKSQLSNYVTAIQMFKGEYGFYPFVTGNSDTTVDLASKSTEFIETLSARKATSGSKVSIGGNRRQINFHSFGESEFFINDADVVQPTQIADRFNNIKLFIAIDGNGDGLLSVPFSAGTGRKQLKSEVTAYVEDDSRINAPAYSLYD
ncbi:MAG: type II secretion system protein [Lentimonas sp.]